jgi:hypothetical protein
MDSLVHLLEGEVQIGLDLDPPVAKVLRGLANEARQSDAPGVIGQIVTH